MGDSSDSVFIDMEALSLGGQEHVVETTYGPVCVAVCGDPDKPALITYPDIALNYMFCFQGLLFCPEASSLLLHNFCIYHISPLGHELGAPVISVDAPLLSADDLADQIVEVLNYFGLGAVMCMGVTAGAYVLTLFASRQSMATKTEEELWIDIEALQRKMEKIKPRITSMEQKLESIIERMEKRWAEEDHRAANEAPLQEETLGSASRMVMQLREESPKARTSAPFSGSLLTEISIGEGKAKTASRLKERSMGFGKAERKETPKLAGEKWTDFELEKNADKVFDEMILVGNEPKRKRKKKFIKAKRKKKKRRTRLKKHEQNNNNAKVGNHSGNGRETKVEYEGNGIVQADDVQLLEYAKLPKTATKKLGKWTKRKQKHNNKDIKERFSVGYDDDGGVKKQMVQVRLKVKRLMIEFKISRKEHRFRHRHKKKRFKKWKRGKDMGSYAEKDTVALLGLVSKEDDENMGVIYAAEDALTTESATVNSSKVIVSVEEKCKWERHMRTWSMDRSVVKPWMWRLFKKKKKNPIAKRERESVWLWQQTGIGDKLSRFVIGVFEFSRSTYSLEITAYNILQSQLEDKLKFKGRSKSIENKTQAERQRVVVLASCQIHSWLSNIIAEHESEEDCPRGSAMKFLVGWIATVGEVVGSTTNDRVHLLRHLFSPIQGILQLNKEWRKGLQNVNLILSTRVKRACWVGFGFSCQDLLTWMEASTSSDVDSKPYMNQAKRILGRVMSLLSSLLHCFLLRSYEALENGSGLFQLGKGDNITVFLQLLDENTWGDYGFITGLGMSTGAIYQAGKSKESNGREKELQQNMANTVEVGLKLLQKQKQRKSSKTWRFKYREIRGATSLRGLISNIMASIFFKLEDKLV